MRLPRTAPAIAEIRNRTIATKKMILAMPTAVPARPPNPSSAAMSAITRKVNAQPSITSSISRDALSAPVGSRTPDATLWFPDKSSRSSKSTKRACPTRAPFRARQGVRYPRARAKRSRLRPTSARRHFVSAGGQGRRECVEAQQQSPFRGLVDSFSRPHIEAFEHKKESQLVFYF